MAPRAATQNLHLRLPAPTVRALRQKAAARGLRPSQLVRELIDQAGKQPAAGSRQRGPCPSVKDALLPRLRDGLARAFGVRFKGLVLYGSEARGEAGPDSDIDVLVLLDQVERPRDPDAVIAVVYPLMLEWPDVRVIDAMPVPVDAYEAQEYPLYRNAKAEGIRL